MTLEAEEIRGVEGIHNNSESNFINDSFLTCFCKGLAIDAFSYLVPIDNIVYKFRTVFSHPSEFNVSF